MSPSPRFLVLPAFALSFAACGTLSGAGGGAPARAADGVLVGPTGMTRYTFDRDAAGSVRSVRNGVWRVAKP